MTLSWILNALGKILHGPHILLRRDHSTTCNASLKEITRSKVQRAALHLNNRLQATASPVICYKVLFFIKNCMCHSACFILPADFIVYRRSEHDSCTKCFSYTLKAILGGATQCDSTERSRTTGDLHCEWRKWRSVCVQSDSRQHCTKSSFRIWRPTTRGTVAPKLNSFLWCVYNSFLMNHRCFQFNGINLRNANEQLARLVIGQQCDTVTILAQYNPHMFQLGNHSRSG